MSHTPRTMLFGAHAYVVGLVPSVRGKAQFCDGGHKLGVARCRRLIRDQPWTWASGHSAATIKRAADGYEATREAAMAAFA